MSTIVDEFLKSLKITGAATVLNKPGALRLDGYPHLAYSPSQWGDGVRTEDVGALVVEIAVAYADRPDPEAVAAKFGTTTAHVADAVRYAVAAGYAEGK